MLLKLLVVLHLIPLMQACPTCGEIDEILVDVKYVSIEPFNYHVQPGGNYYYSPPFDRNTLHIRLNLMVDDSLHWYVHKPTGGLMNQALAWQECEDFYVTIKQSIANVELYEIESGMQLNRTSEFLAVDGYGKGLYKRIDQYLSDKDVKYVDLAAKYQPPGDTVVYLVKTEITGGTVFSDTLKIPLK